MSKAVDFSIVVPVYYNESTLEYTANKIRKEVFEKCKWRGEIIFVDDGSGDRSFEVLKRLQSEHPEDIRVFKLSRNFGQGRAVRCGDDRASGAVIHISADGQDPIGRMPLMLQKHFEDGCEVVFCYRESRAESWWRRVTSRITYFLIKKLGHPDMPTGGFDYVLLGERAKTEYNRTFQPHTFGQVRLLNLGFKRAWIPYRREERKGDKSRWTFAKKFTYMIDGVLGHSYLPIRLMSIVGICSAGLSVLLGGFFLVSYIVHGGHSIKGWTPIVLLILFSGGIQMLMIGVLGEYLWRVLAQVRNDVPYIVELKLDATEQNV